MGPEEKTIHLYRLYSVLSGINQLIMRTTDRQRLFHEACLIAVERGGFRMAWVGLVDEDTQSVIPAAFGGREDGYLATLKITVRDEPEGQGPVGMAIRRGAHFVCNSVQDDPGTAPWRDEALKRGYMSCAAFPIKQGKYAAGAFAVYSAEPGFFDEEKTGLLDELAADMSFALHHMEQEGLRKRAEKEREEAWLCELAALKEAEKGQRTLDALMESIPEGILIVDGPPGEIRMVSGYGLEIFGLSPADAAGMPLEAFMERCGLCRPDGKTPLTVEELPIARAVRYGDTCQREEVVLGRPGAGGMTLLCSAAPIIDQDGNITGGVGAFRDISDRKRMECRARLNSIRLEALAELGQLRDASVEELCDFALEKGIGITGSKIGYLFFYDEDARVFTLYSWSKGAAEQCSVTERQTVFELDKTGLWGEAVRQRRPVITNDYSAENPLKRGRPQGHVRLTRHMNLPVFEGERIVAVIGVGNKETVYDETDVLQLRLLMEGTWRIIGHKRAEEALKRSEERLALALGKAKEEAEVSEALLNIVEAVNSTLDENALIKTVVKMTPRYLRFDRIVVFLYDDKTRSFAYADGFGLSSVDEGMLMSRVFGEQDIPAIGETLKKGMLVIENAARTELIPAELVRTFRLGSLAIASISMGGSTMGGILADYKTARPIDKKELSLLKGLAHGIAVALRNSRLYKESVQRLMDLSVKIETINAMSQIDREILSNIDQAAILRAATALLNRVVPCDRAAVLLREGEMYRVVSEWGAGEFLGRRYGAKGDFREGLVKRHSPLYMNDISKDACRYHRELAASGIRSALMLPLISSSGPVGFLDIGSTNFGRLSAEHLSTAEKIASQITVALEHARLYEELQQLLVNTITSLVSAIDAKSPWAKGHSERVTSYAVEIGGRMGLDHEGLERLRLAGLLHDIGKIGTFDMLLDKPDRLTDEEFELVKKHPRKGAEILAPIKQLGAILPAIVHHHECYDGTGYPDGLKGEDIPLHARILCVADAFDSMTAERPYRPAPGAEFAVSEFRRCAGTQFDPAVVEVFIGILCAMRQAA